MNRLDRLTAILIQLQSKRTVRAQEIADRFGISLRTVYRDVRSLEAAGLPVIGEAGIGYSLAEGYRLPPVQFTRDEAASFLAAEKLVENFTDTGVEAQYKSALLKVRAVLRMADKDFLENLDASIQILPGRGRATGNPASAVLPVVMQGISDREVLSARYGGGEGMPATLREIEPIGVFFRNDKWYLLAWCRLRSDLRHFRLDRMEKLQRTGRHFEAHDLNLQDHLAEANPTAGRLPATLRVETDVLRYIDAQKQQQGFQRQTIQGEEATLHFEVVSYEYLARWMMQFADKILAIEPLALASIFQKILGKAIGRFQ
jgi:predicted DNA-binding transcriptional regulator YafY